MNKYVDMNHPCAKCTRGNGKIEQLERDLAAARAEAARLRECNQAMREPMRKLREAVNMPAQGEGQVVDAVLRDLAAARAWIAAQEKKIAL